MSEQAQREVAHWQQWHDRADDLWGWSTPAGLERAARRARLFLEQGRMTPQSLVLEIGCGYGEYTYRIAPHVQTLYATDISPELLNQTRQRLQANCPSARVLTEIQDATALTYHDGMFDAVFGCSILHHVNAGQSLREVARVLKPGGWCVFSEPNMANPQILLQKNIGWLKRRAGDTTDETAFFAGQIRRLLHAAGLADTCVQHFDFLHPATPRRLIPLVDKIGRAIENIPLLRAISGSLLFSGCKPS